MWSVSESRRFSSSVRRGHSAESELQDPGAEMDLTETEQSLLKQAEMDLTETEQSLLKQFRKNLADVLTPDYTDRILMKWLRARNFNLRKCEQVFREFQSYRAMFKLDTIVEDFKVPEVALKYNFQTYLGEAKDGSPLGYIAFGRADLYGFVASLTQYQAIRFCVYEVEKYVRRLKKQSEKFGREITEASFIVDMEGFSLRETIKACVIEMGLDLLQLLQDTYPEIWKNIFIINAPFYFYQAFNIIRPICRYTFLRHFHVVSKDDSAQLLLKYVEADQLPAFLGGKRLDSGGDPRCSHFINFGGKIPEEYYLSNKAPLLAMEAGVQDVWIGPRSFYNHCFVVHSRSRVKAEVRTEGGSILGCLLYRSFDSPSGKIDIPAKDEYLSEHDDRCNVRLVSPYFKIQTHLSPIDDEYDAPWPGIYIARFDNSSNWVTSRRLLIRIQTTPWIKNQK